MTPARPKKPTEPIGEHWFGSDGRPDLEAWRRHCQGLTDAADGPLIGPGGMPDLQAWITAAGGYSRIDWVAWDAAVAAYQAGLRDRACGFASKPTASAFEQRQGECQRAIERGGAHQRALAEMLAKGRQ